MLSSARVAGAGLCLAASAARRARAPRSPPSAEASPMALKLVASSSSSLAVAVADRAADHPMFLLDRAAPVPRRRPPPKHVRPLEDPTLPFISLSSALPPPPVTTLRLLEAPKVVIPDIVSSAQPMRLSAEPPDVGEAKGGGGEPAGDRPNHDVLQQVAGRIADQFTCFFRKEHDDSLYLEDVVFENRIHGKVSVGLSSYLTLLRALKIYGHARYAFVRCNVLSVSTHQDRGTVEVRWQLTGLGLLSMAIRFLPQQLWRRENFVGAAKPWLEGVSTFHLDRQGLVARHVVDNREEERERTRSGAAGDGLREQIGQKLAKLRGEKEPAPAM